MPPVETRPSRLTLATRVTLVRIVLALGLGPLLLVLPDLAGAALIGFLGLTDYLDGYLARKRNEVSALGAALDPIADKLVTVAALIAFVADGTLGGVHLYAVFAILLREILIAGLREAAGTSVSLKVSPLAKWKTTVQFLAFLLLCFGPAPLALGFLWMAAVLTVWTGAGYVISWWSSAE